jgi:hypothetical protein
MNDARTHRRATTIAADKASVAKASKSAINRDLRRAEKLGDDFNKIAGTSLDKSASRWVRLSIRHFRRWGDSV